MPELTWRIDELSQHGRQTLGYADTEVGAQQATPHDRPGYRHEIVAPTGRALTRSTTRPGTLVDVERTRSRTRYRGTVVGWTTVHLMIQTPTHKILTVPTADVWHVTPVR